MKLAILLTSGRGSENTRTVAKLTEAALRQGHEVGLFLMRDGVYNVEALAPLAEGGATLAVCAHNATQRNVPSQEECLWGSQYDWANMVQEVDRVLVFG